jgi:O-antigen/teichoic acid export membrane protein
MVCNYSGFITTSGSIMRKQLLNDSFVYLSGSVIVQSLGFLGMILLMKYLPIAQYGQYTYVIEFISIFAFFSDGGFNQYIIREVTRRPEDQKSIYATAQATQILISILIIFLIAAIAFPVSSRQNFYFLMIFGVGMVLNTMFTPMIALLIAQSRTDLLLYKDIINAISKLLFILIGILTKASLVYFFYIGFANFALLAFFFSFLTLRNRTVSFFTLNFNFKENILFVKQGIVFTILMTANIIYNKIDVLMLEKMRGYTEVGYYSGATRFIYPFMFISTSFMTAIFPRLVRYSNDPEKSKNLQYLSLYYLGGIGIVLSTALYLGSSLLFNTFFNDKFDSSIPVFDILVWYLAIVFIYGTISNNLVARNRVAFLVYLNSSMIFVNIGINYYLIPPYGAVGAAISTVTCELLILIIATIYWRYSVLRAGH